MLCSRSRSRSKVTWYERFCADHENRFLSQANSRIATKLTHDGPQVRLHPGCAHGQDQRSRARGSFVLARKTLLLWGKWPDCDQTCTRSSPGQRACRMCPVSRSRSKVMWYRHFCARPKIAFSRRQMARLRLNLHTMVPRCACIQGVLKVKVTFCAGPKIAFGKNRYFSHFFTWFWPSMTRKKLGVDLLDYRGPCGQLTSDSDSRQVWEEFSIRLRL